jgi:hypothetical protein
MTVSETHSHLHSPPVLTLWDHKNLGSAFVHTECFKMYYCVSILFKAKPRTNFDRFWYKDDGVDMTNWHKA